NSLAHATYIGPVPAIYDLCQVFSHTPEIGAAPPRPSRFGDNGRLPHRARTIHRRMTYAAASEHPAGGPTWPTTAGRAAAAGTMTYVIWSSYMEGRYRGQMDGSASRMYQ